MARNDSTFLRLQWVRGFCTEIGIIPKDDLGTLNSSTFGEALARQGKVDPEEAGVKKGPAYWEGVNAAKILASLARDKVAFPIYDASGVKVDEILIVDPLLPGRLVGAVQGNDTSMLDRLKQELGDDGWWDAAIIGGTAMVAGALGYWLAGRPGAAAGSAVGTAAGEHRVSGGGYIPAWLEPYVAAYAPNGIMQAEKLMELEAAYSKGAGGAQSENPYTPPPASTPPVNGGSSSQGGTGSSAVDQILGVAGEIRDIWDELGQSENE